VGQVDILNTHKFDEEGHFDKLYSYSSKWEAASGENDDDDSDDFAGVKKFPKAKEIAIVGGYSGSKPNSGLLAELLESDEIGAHWIYFSDFDWSSGSEEEKIKARELVNKTGLKGNETAFVLTGSPDWAGRVVDQKSKNEFQHLHFKWYQFWKSYSASPLGSA